MRQFESALVQMTNDLKERAVVVVDEMGDAPQPMPMDIIEEVEGVVREAIETLRPQDDHLEASDHADGTCVPRDAAARGSGADLDLQAARGATAVDVLAEPDLRRKNPRFGRRVPT